MTSQASSGRSALWVPQPRGLRGPRSSQRAMTEATLPAGGSGAQAMVSVSDPVPPCVCRADGASQSGLDPPLRSAHTTVPEIRHARPPRAAFPGACLAAQTKRWAHTHTICPKLSRSESLCLPHKSPAASTALGHASSASKHHLKDAKDSLGCTPQACKRCTRPAQFHPPH